MMCHVLFREEKDKDTSEYRKENMGTSSKAVIPLCWQDQVQENGAKVLTPRGPPKEKRTIVS